LPKALNCNGQNKKPKKLKKPKKNKLKTSEKRLKKRERADSFPLLKAGAHLWQLKTY